MTVRHRFPSAVRVNVTPVPPVPTVLPRLSSPSSATAPAAPVLVLGVPDAYYPQAPPSHIHADLGLDGPGIAASVIRALEAAESVPGR